MAKTKQTTSTAQELYDAYGDHADWKNFQGNAMPAWKDLTDVVRGHWQAVADQFEYFDLELTDREALQVEHAQMYAENFPDAGVPGHVQFMLIAKLARALNL